MKKKKLNKSISKRNRAGKFTISLLIFLFLIPLIVSEEPPMPSIPGQASIENLGQKFSEGEIDPSTYLKQEWDKIIENSKTFGPAYKEYKQNFAPYIDPVIGFLVGIKPSFSWLFLTALVFYITIATSFWRVTDYMPLIESDVIKFLIWLFIMLSVSFTGTSFWISKKVVDSISLITTWQGQLIVTLIVIIGLMIAIIFSKAIEEFFKGSKERKKKAKEEMKRIELDTQLKIAKNLGKVITKPGKSLLGKTGYPDI